VATLGRVTRIGRLGGSLVAPSDAINF